MLKTYEVKLPQADIEFLMGALEHYGNAHLNSDAINEAAVELGLKLNGVLTCEAGECDEKRKGMDTFCSHCASVRDDARRTYQGAKLAGWIKPSESGRPL